MVASVIIFPYLLIFGIDFWNTLKTLQTETTLSPTKIPRIVLFQNNPRGLFIALRNSAGAKSYRWAKFLEFLLEFVAY